MAKKGAIDPKNLEDKNWLAKREEALEKMTPEDKIALRSRAYNLLRESIGVLCSKDVLMGYLLCSVNSSVEWCGTARAGLIHGNFVVQVDPWFFAELLKPQERIAILEHEALHLLHLHPTRMDKRDWEKWNMACDLAINPYIENLPDGALIPPDEWRGLAAEEIYEKIPTIEIPMSALMDYFDKAHGANSEVVRGAVKRVMKDISDATGMSEREVRKMLKDKVKETGADERQKNTHNRGYEPGSNMIEVDAEKTTFEMGLRSLMSTRSDEYRRTLKRPHRRMGDSYPWGRRREEQTRIVVAVDNSGSISRTLLNRFFGEILKLKAISDDVQVIVADSQVQNVFPLKHERDFKRVSGGGGTDFDPAIIYANENFRDYDLMIYLTDGECSMPVTKPNLPLIWVVTDVQDWPGRPLIYAPELSDGCH